MKVESTPLDGAFVIEPKCFRDERGFFLEVYQVERYKRAGIQDDFVQENHSHSMKKGILRGMHFQVQRPQAQIITVFSGCIFDAIVDVRPRSPTFGRWFGVQLSDEGPRQMYMAPGFAHGFLVLSEGVDIHYNVSRNYDLRDEGGLFWNDPDIGICWPIERPSLHARDLILPRLRELSLDQLPHDPPADDLLEGLRL